MAKESSEEIPADTVVLALGSRSDQRLKERLEQAGLAFTLIGDGRAPRQVLQAVSEGHQAALDL